MRPSIGSVAEGLADEQAQYNSSAAKMKEDAQQRDQSLVNQMLPAHVSKALTEGRKVGLEGLFVGRAANP